MSNPDSTSKLRVITQRWTVRARRMRIGHQHRIGGITVAALYGIVFPADVRQIRPDQLTMQAKTAAMLTGSVATIRCA